MPANFIPLKTGEKFGVTCFCGGLVLLVILWSLALSLQTGILQMPANSIPTTCVFQSRGVTERYAATTSCSCSAYSGPSDCVNSIGQLDQFDPVTCEAGTGPCPDTNSTCGDGYACCSRHCKSDESPHCFCDSSVSNQLCVVVPYLVYFASFSGDVVQFDPNSNGDTLNQFVINEPYNTSSGLAFSRVSEVPLFTVTPCYYDPHNTDSVTFSPYSENEFYLSLFFLLGIEIFLFGVMMFCMCVGKK